MYYLHSIIDSDFRNTFIVVSTVVNDKDLHLLCFHPSLTTGSTTPFIYLLGLFSLFRLDLNQLSLYHSLFCLSISTSVLPPPLFSSIYFYFHSYFHKIKITSDSQTRRQKNLELFSLFFFC